MFHHSLKMLAIFWQVTSAVGIAKMFSASTLGCRLKSSLRLRGGLRAPPGFNRYDHTYDLYLHPLPVPSPSRIFERATSPIQS